MKPSVLRRDFFSAYKGVRNYFRRFKPVSILQRSIEFLHSPSSGAMQDLQKHPWQVLLIVKWVCQDPLASDVTGTVISAIEYDELRQRTFDLPEVAELGTRDTLPGFLFMRQLLRPQIGFQRRLSIGYAREAAFLLAEPKDGLLPTLFKSRTGLTPEAFIDLALALSTAILGGKKVIEASWLAPLQTAYSDAAVQAFISTMSRDYDGLRRFFKSIPDSSARRASEFFEFPTITRFPLLRDGQLLACWHPMVYYRGIEGLVHSVLSEAGQAYIDAFSKKFEKHVVDVATLVPTTIIKESDLQKLVPPGSQVPDALLSFDDCNVFVESKAGLFDESVMAVGHSEMFAHKTKALRKAIYQAWSASTGLRRARAAPDPVRNATRDFLLIVTNKDLSASRGTMLAAMYPDGTLAYPDAEAERLLPLSNVYVLTVEDFERLAIASSNKLVDLPMFLRNCVEADQDRESAVFYFEQHLEKHHIPRDCSLLVRNAIESAQQRLEAALQLG